METDLFLDLLKTYSDQSIEETNWVYRVQHEENIQRQQYLCKCFVWRYNIFAGVCRSVENAKKRLYSNSFSIPPRALVQKPICNIRRFASKTTYSGPKHEFLYAKQPLRYEWFH